MTRFLDGPAAGEVLMLQRAPDYLRAVQNALSGAWDALDLLKDTPGPTDLLIVAYRRVGDRTSCHVDWTRQRSGWYMGGSYELVAEQPADDVLRDTERWRAWCWERKRIDAAIKAEA